MADDARTHAQRHLGDLLDALAECLPPMTPEEEAHWDALRARREQRQREREAARALAMEPVTEEATP